MVFLFYFVFDISKGVVYSACILHNVSEAHINIRTKIMLVENIRKKKPIQSNTINWNQHQYVFFHFCEILLSCENIALAVANAEQDLLSFLYFFFYFLYPAKRQPPTVCEGRPSQKILNPKIYRIQYV